MIKEPANEHEMLRLQAAEKLGWKEVEYSHDGYLVGHAPGRRDIKPVPSYASDIRAAWEIVSHLMATGATVRITNPGFRLKQFIVEIRQENKPIVRIMHECAPVAICQAFIEEDKAA